MTGKQPADPATPQLGYAYLAYNPVTGLYKIGSARRPLTRLNQLCSEMCSRCVLLHTIATNASLRLEREIQQRFLMCHQGGEWFQLDASQVAIVMSVSGVFYRDVGWQPRSATRIAFDNGSTWAKKLPICDNLRKDGAA